MDYPTKTRRILYCKEQHKGTFFNVHPFHKMKKAQGCHNFRIFFVIVLNIFLSLNLEVNA